MEFIFEDLNARILKVKMILKIFYLLKTNFKVKEKICFPCEATTNSKQGDHFPKIYWCHNPPHAREQHDHPFAEVGLKIFEKKTASNRPECCRTEQAGSCLGPVLLELLDSLEVEISLSLKELVFKPFFADSRFLRTAVSRYFFKILGSRQTPVSHSFPNAHRNGILQYPFFLLFFFFEQTPFFLLKLQDMPPTSPEGAKRFSP
jgi:hypothetical protein